MNFRDAEILSEYLDEQLNPSEVARIEKRLAADAALRGVLDDLRVARGLARQVPRHRVPRNFTLKPTMAKIRGPEPRAAPTLRFASALASLLFLATLAVNGLAPLAARSLAQAPQPMYGKGGGGGGGGSGGAPDVTHVPPESFAGAAPAGTLEPLGTGLPGDKVLATAPAPGEVAPKALPPAAAETAPLSPPAKPPVPVVWLWVLAAAALILGALAFYVRRQSEHSFRSRQHEN